MKSEAWLNRLSFLAEPRWLDRRWPKVLLFLVCLLLGLAWGFPSTELAGMAGNALQQHIGRPVQLAAVRLQLPLRLATAQVQVDSGGPLGTVTLHDVRLSPAWSALLRGRLALSLRGRLGSGVLAAEVATDGSVDGSLRDLGGTLPLPAFGSLQVAGQLEEARLKGRFPAEGAGTIDQLSLRVTRLQVSGLSALGAEQDSLDLGPLTVNGSTDQRRLQLNGTGESTALPLSAEGFIFVRAPLQNSPLNLRLTARPAANLGERLRSLLSLGARPQPDGQLEWRVAGTVGRPVLR